jgi:hypothetical protein
MNEIKFPHEIERNITNEFLATLKDNLDETFADKMPSSPTYWNFYQWFDSTGGFYSSLKKACKTHHFMKLYKYLTGLKWYDSDILDASLTEMLYKNGIIEEGSIQEMYNEYETEVHLID